MTFWQSCLNRPLLGEVCGGRDNNLNLIRMIAASAVIFSHAFPIAYGIGTEEPLEGLTGYSLGWTAVAVFFVVSGFLITRSFDRRPSLARWSLARVLRLYPGLIVVLLLTVFVLGPTFTTLPAEAYFTANGTLTYLPANLSLAFLQYPLPGVFADNAFPRVINGSLWTLFYEVVCYFGVLAAGLLGLLKRKYVFTAFVGMLAIAAGLLAHFGPIEGGAMVRVNALVRLAFPFALGMAAYLWRDRLRLDIRLVAAVWLAAILAWFTPLFPVVFVGALSFTVLFLGYVPSGAVRSYNRLGDYSYGTYIYAFPMQQMVQHLNPQGGWAANVAFAIPPTVVLAILSWHLVEKRALALAKFRAPPALKISETVTSVQKDR